MEPQGVERRLATILVAGVVGYTPFEKFLDNFMLRDAAEAAPQHEVNPLVVKNLTLRSEASRRLEARRASRVVSRGFSNSALHAQRCFWTICDRFSSFHFHNDRH